MKALFEKVPSSVESSFNAFIYEAENFETPWHFHPEYELTYIVKGEGTRFVGNSVQEFKKRDFVLLGTNLPHYWKNHDNLKGGVQSIVLQWDDSVLGENWLEKKEFHSIKRILSDASKGLSFRTIENDVILERLQKIITQKPLEKLLALLLLLEDLSKIKEVETLSSDGFVPNLNSKANDRINLIYNYIQENYNQKIRLNEIADLVHMNEETFCRFFKKNLGKSFFTFVNEYRINLICKQLIETKKQVSEIAYECGYESLPFFYRQFQKFMKCSPLVFRKKYHLEHVATTIKI